MVSVFFMKCVRLCILVLFLAIIDARKYETEKSILLGGDDDVADAYGQLRKKISGKHHRIKSQFEAGKTMDRKEYCADYDLHAVADTSDGFQKKANRRKREGYVECVNECGQCANPPPIPGGSVNVAWNKPAWQSSFYGGSTLPGISCYGLDHIRRGTTYNNWFQTAEGDDRAYWLVDLQTEYTIAEMYLTRRDVTEYPHDADFQRNSVITVNGILCYEFSPNIADLRGPSFWVTFTKPTRGRYVHIQKKESVHGQNPNDVYIVYAEVQIFVCPDGKFLKDRTTCEPCEAPCKYPCDEYYGCNTFVLYNVAMKEKATAPSTVYGTAASTVDGRTKAARLYEECMGAYSTDAGDSKNRFLWIEFSRPNYVYYILVQPRLDCCANLMYNLYLLVFGHLEQAPLSLDEDRAHQPEEICYHSAQPFSDGQTKNFTCYQSPVLAYHVALQAIYPSQLLVCEVTVMGYPVTVLSAGQTGCEAGAFIICGKGLVCKHDVCKIILGENCRTNQTVCVVGTVCDGDKCSLQHNSDCFSHPELCASGTDCDTSADFRCKTVLGGSCKSSSDCFSNKDDGYICDFLSECRKASGGACSSSTKCLAGASCVNSICQCTTPVSGTSGLYPINNNNNNNKTSGLCQPSCIARHQCPANSFCDINNYTCKCDASHEFHRRDFTCVSGEASITAACQDSGDCSRNLVCQSQKCKVPLRSFCEVDENCVAGTVCENHSCRYGSGSACNLTDSGACKVSTVCEDGKCKLKVGEKCSADVDQCASSTTCSVHAADKKCLLKVGETCDGDNSTLCVDDAVCDTGNVCRNKIGGTCDSMNKKRCKYRSVCQDSTCRLVFGANCMGNEKNCVEGLTCDALHQCRIPKSASCKDLPDGCLAGGLCDINDVCVCNALNTVSSNALCEPVPGAVGGTCYTSSDGNRINAGSCYDRKATCDGTTNTCKCAKGIMVNRTNYTCNFGPGESCNFTHQCGSGMTCGAAKICQMIPGESCSGHENGCVRRTVCDEDEVCRWEENADCTSSPSDCQLAHVCDLIFKCKRPAGSPCYNDENCAAGASCVDSKCTCTDGVSMPSLQGDGCVPVDGKIFGRCAKEKKCEDRHAVCNSDGKCECQEGYQVNDDLSCGTALGQGCSQDAECSDGMSCDSSKQCRVKLGNPCYGERKNQCGAQVVCDTNNKCKLDMNGNCSGVNVTHCKSGTFCDKLGRCRLDVDNICKSTIDCPAGALCENNFCRCETGKASKANLVCEPLAGRVGSACHPASAPCTVPGAKCESGTCRCSERKQYTQDFACAEKSEGENPSSWSTEIILVVALGAVAGLFLVSSVVCLVKHSGKKLEGELVAQPERQALPQQPSELTEQKALEPDVLEQATEGDKSDTASDVSSESATSDTSNAAFESIETDRSVLYNYNDLAFMYLMPYINIEDVNDSEV